MTQSSASAWSGLYRASLDLVAARLHGELQLFDCVLDELNADYQGEGVLGVLGVTSTLLNKVAVVYACPATEVLSEMGLEAPPPLDEAIPDTLAMLYARQLDVRQARDLAEEVAAGRLARPAMTVMSDISVTMVSEYAGWASLPVPMVFGTIRAEYETLFSA